MFGPNYYQKYITFLYAIGFFSEIIMLILVVVLLRSQYLDLITYIIGINISPFLNRFLKSFIKQKRPNDPIKFLNCEDFTNKNKVVYGMPSGHSQNVFFSLTFLYLCFNSITTWVLVGAGISVIMTYERWAFHNHTLMQLIAGAAVGAAFAYVVFFIKNQIQRNIRFSF